MYYEWHTMVDNKYFYHVSFILNGHIRYQMHLAKIILPCVENSFHKTKAILNRSMLIEKAFIYFFIFI